ncbi:hypothetical protein BN8_02088 [Fibrisoma limi BUZ 3]|uniref:Uncharacterized protein n=1 Tax=Fibrisoma limi BUZ 3 TaxID=1185876 RepID=I2GGK3_9BACT|nr:hypothetical protein BN8_02088 [Fibrisoma limi BUZ 3]
MRLSKGWYSHIGQLQPHLNYEVDKTKVLLMQLMNLAKSEKSE